MEKRTAHILFRFVRAIWRGVDLSRRIVVNAIFLILVIVLFAAAGERQSRGCRPRRRWCSTPRRPGRAAHRRPGDPGDAQARRLGRPGDAAQGRPRRPARRQGRQAHRGRLPRPRRDGRGRDDQAPRTSRRPLARLQEVSGKKVIAASDAYDTRGYYLAAQADEVLPQPDGHGPDPGLRPLPALLQGGLDKFEVDLARLPRRRVQVGGRALPAQRHVARGARRPTSTSSATSGAPTSPTSPRRARRRRRPSPRFIERMPERLKASGGDAAQIALEAKLVDKLSAATRCASG